MAGHPLLTQTGEKSDVVSVDGIAYYIHLSWHRIVGIDGNIVGLKFADQKGSTDSAKRGHVNPYLLGKAISMKVVQMLEPELDRIAVFGFYLLTGDIEDRHEGGGVIKVQRYNAQALKIHAGVKHKLQHLTRFEVQGGVAWAMSENDFATYEHFKIFENELAKQIRISSC